MANNNDQSSANVTPVLGIVPGNLAQGFATNLMVISHYFERETLARLQQSADYSKLSLEYVGYMALLAQRDCSPGELAAVLSVSKQACSKVIRELQDQGLIEKRKNPKDSRSSFISPSEKGLHLIRQGIAITLEIYNGLHKQLGSDAMQALNRALERVCEQLNLATAQLRRLPSTAVGEADIQPAQLNLFLPKLDKFIRGRAKQAVLDQGFTGLKDSFGPVLGMISREAKHIQFIAQVLGISKQAVAASAQELEAQGYIERQADSNDKRQTLLVLTAKGELLMQRSQENVSQTEADIRALLTEREFDALETGLEHMYLAVAKHYDSANVLREKIQQLSQMMIDELGMTGANALGQHLITITRGRS
ncbi:MarR family winged helix-turn-helix transcriptional regulator [Halioxenophilus aromaticivorans]